jgi:hypothetical protein
MDAFNQNTIYVAFVLMSLVRSYVGITLFSEYREEEQGRAFIESPVAKCVW